MVAVVILGSLGLSEWSDDGTSTRFEMEDVRHQPIPHSSVPLYRDEVVDIAGMFLREDRDHSWASEGVVGVLYPTPAPTPTPVQDMPEPTEGVPLGNTETDTPAWDMEIIVAAFLEGYRDGDGDPAWEAHLVDVVLPCESEWRLNPPGIHLGPAQFARSTWETVAGISGFWDYTDPYHVGYNVALWMARIAPHYGSSAGWPGCWR